jgi:hypothetical protein
VYPWASAENLGFAGFDNWRLPRADPSCGPSFNCIENEMGHLYYTELQNLAGGPLTNKGFFMNLYPDVYWCGGYPP